MMFGMNFDAGRRSPVGFRPLAARRSETERELLARTSRENVRNVLEIQAHDFGAAWKSERATAYCAFCACLGLLPW